MAFDKVTLHLLIIEDSQNEVERLANLFRNAGHATRIQRVNTGNELEHALRQSTWDLVLVSPACNNITPTEAIRRVRQTHTDTPLIQLTATDTPAVITAALLEGAQDALPSGEDEWLMLVAKRELTNLANRRAYQRAEQTLNEVQQRCQLLLESSQDAIAYVHEGMHIHANQTYQAFFGYNGDELEGTPLIDLVAPNDQPALKECLKAQSEATASEQTLTCHALRTQGPQLPITMQLCPAQYEGESCTQILIRRPSEPAQALSAPFIDSSAAPDTWQTHFLALADTKLAAETKASVALLQIDRFTKLRAELGFVAYDHLLTLLAEQLRKHLPDIALLVPFGSDLFAALQLETTPNAFKDALNQALDSIKTHLFELAGRTVQLTLSVGVADWERNRTTLQETLDRAYRCCLQAESNQLVYYDPAKELAAEASRGNIQALVQQALDNNAFRLLFQPIISLRATDDRERYEVLLRLLTPEGEEISPAKFLGAAEQTGMVSAIDQWVISHSIQHLQKQLASGHKTQLFIHLSKTALQDPDCLPWLTECLKNSQLSNASALVFQITETDARTYLKQAQGLFSGLVELGCKIALSQFGQAALPFETLNHLPAEFVKIDRSLIQNLDKADSKAKLLALLETLHEQGKRSIVPHVESASILTILWQAGVNYVQGYYLQAPTRQMDYDFSANGQ